jgi:hypothetical protein
MLYVSMLLAATWIMLSITKNEAVHLYTNFQEVEWEKLTNQLYYSDNIYSNGYIDMVVIKDGHGGKDDL